MRPKLKSHGHERSRFAADQKEKYAVPKFAWIPFVTV
jgi:hypothetical protein